MNVRKIIQKVQKAQERRAFLNKISFLLKSGTYFIERRQFYRLQNPRFKELKHHFKTVRIKPKNSYKFTYDHGRYHISPYKYVVIFEDYTYYLTKERKRYIHIKERLLSFENKIPYLIPEVSFDDSRQMMILNTVSGNQHNDEKHFHQFIQYCFESLKHTDISVKAMAMGEQCRDIVFCVQHGDCNNRNILWDDYDNITLIDLDDINEYPMFYDLFYYILSVCHESAFSFYQQNEFILQIKQICEAHHIQFKEETIDIYLAAYVYYHVNKLTRGARYHDSYFYLKFFMSSDLSAYPITLQAIHDYRKKLEYYQIRLVSE